jgi:hypothetical protein
VDTGSIVVYPVKPICLSLPSGPRILDRVYPCRVSPAPTNPCGSWFHKAGIVASDLWLSLAWRGCASEGGAAA